MSDDIVTRLRSEAMSWFPHTTPRHPIPTLINEAADDIERLRQQTERLHSLLLQVVQNPHPTLLLGLLSEIRSELGRVTS